MNANEERTLLELASSGDIKAKNSLVLSNIAFIISIAKHYQNRGLSLNDLVSEGIIGFYDALQKINIHLPWRLKTVVIWYIKRAIISAINKYGENITVPYVDANKIWKVSKFINRYYLLNGTEPSFDLINRHLIIEGKKALTEEFTHNAFASFEAFSYANVGLDIADASGDFDLYSDSLHKEIRISLGKLTKREQDIIISFFGINCEPLTLEEISFKYDLSKERIRQIKEKALNKLKKDANLRQLLG